MHNKYIFYIIAANILWSFVPVLASDLIGSTSILMIIFLRFLVSGVVLFCIALSLVFYNNKFTTKQEITILHLFQYTLAKNNSFYNITQLLYLFLLGFFGIFIHIFSYFLTLKLSSISFAMVGFQVSVILIALYEHGVKLEKLDFFKILYLLILIFCILIIFYINFQKSSQIPASLPFINIFYLIMFFLSMTFLHISLGKDSYTKDEILLLNKNKNYKIVRMLLKISLIFFFTVLSLFPFAIIFYVFPVEPTLHEETVFFLNDLTYINSIFFNIDLIVLICFSTIIPYLLIFIANVNWSPFNLTYSQWNSILTVIEPTFALFFGVLFAYEYFPLEFLIIVVFLLAISILFRYAHETHNKVNACILLKKHQKKMKSIPLQLLKFNGVVSVQALIGQFDILINVQTSSIKALYYLINNQIRTIEGVISVDLLFINQIAKI